MSETVIEFNKRRLAESRAAAPVWTVSDRIRKIRRDAGLTQAEFSLRVDVPKGSIQAWEAGSSKPGRSALLLLSVRCQVEFGVPAWWTVGETQPWDVLSDPDPRTRATAELLLFEAMQSGGLPRMDSNHQPAGYRYGVLAVAS